MEIHLVENTVWIQSKSQKRHNFLASARGDRLTDNRFRSEITPIDEDRHVLMSMVRLRPCVMGNSLATLTFQRFGTSHSRLCVYCVQRHGKAKTSNLGKWEYYMHTDITRINWNLVASERNFTSNDATMLLAAFVREQDRIQWQTVFWYCFWAAEFVYLPENTDGELARIITTPYDTAEVTSIRTRVIPKVSGLAAWSQNCKWYSSLQLGRVVSLFCE